MACQYRRSLLYINAMNQQRAPENTRSVYFVSLGCNKNQVDSEVMLGMLEKDRYRIVYEPASAEVIIVNTCSFIQAAQKESIDTILEMADYKINGKCKALVVAGCLPQKFSKELEKDLPEIDLMIGTGQYHRITEFLNSTNDLARLNQVLGRRSYIDQPAFIHSEKDPRILTGASHSAYLKISEGCNRRCTFCIIPSLRGDVRSRSVDSLVTEAKRLVESGVRELSLVAQDLTHYGIDLDSQDNLEALLPRLAEIDHLNWIRLHYVYPDQLSSELIDLISENSKIVNYLDMPIQHTNDRILKRMGRKLTKERLYSVVTELRKKMPDFVFRTSIIVGFPGETVSEFEELKRDLIELSLDHVGVFRYSNEDGSAASRLDEHVPAAESKRRYEELIDILEKISMVRNNKYIGKTVPVMIEGYSKETELLLEGRMSTQAKEVDGTVLINDIPAGLKISPGDIVTAEVTDALPYNLVARILS